LFILFGVIVYIGTVFVLDKQLVKDLNDFILKKVKIF